MFDKLLAILGDQLHVPVEGLTPETTLADAELDSLALVELSLILEKSLGFEIPEESLTGVTTLGDVVGLMENAGTRA
ncbi:acyl carrier protein [Streptomyces sp. NPDC087300]|uniref:acyl carrier protein n=1 Tax=Streptomyces sp. NPDC087300 TaxID=3365780 RepID=UPI0038049DA5